MSDINLPNTKSELHDKTVKHVTFMRDLTSGTEHIHTKRETYLPKYNREDDEDYNERLANSELLPATEEAIYSITGKLLLADTVLEDMTANFNADNVDNAGTTLASFENNLTQTAIRDGLSYILVDFPVVNGVVTQLDKQRVNAKAYFLPIQAEQVINHRTALINNETKLTQVTLKMVSLEAKGDFGEESVTRYYVYRNINGLVTLDKWVEDNKDGGLSIEEQGIVIKGVSEIPLVPFYTNKKAMFDSPSLLREHAVLNQSWYRMNSALKRSIERACDPTPVLSGWSAPLDENGQEKDLSIGSSEMLIIGEEAKFEWVGASSDVIQPTKDEIKDIETRMAKIATELLNTDSEMTATEANISNTDTEAKLGSIQTNRENCLNRAYELKCQFDGVNPTGKLITNRDFSTALMENERVTNLRNDMLAGVITKETYLKERQKGGELLTVKDIEAELTLAEDEQALTTQDTFNEGE